VHNQQPHTPHPYPHSHTTHTHNHTPTLAQVYYSDKLHYSANAGYEDSSAPGRCCAIQ